MLPLHVRFLLLYCGFPGLAEAEVNCHVRDQSLLTCFLRRRLDRGVQEQLSYGTTDGDHVGASRLSPTALARVPRLKATTGNHDRDQSGVPGGDVGGSKAAEPAHGSI